MKSALIVAPVAGFVGFMLAIALRAQPVPGEHLPRRCTMSPVPLKPAATSRPDPGELNPGEALRVGSRSFSWADLIARVQDVESNQPDGPKIAGAAKYLIGSALLESEAVRLGVEIKEKVLAGEIHRQIQELKRRFAANYGGALVWENWLKEYGFHEHSFGENLSKSCRIVLLKRILVNAWETRTTEASLKDLVDDFLKFADVGDARFKRWCEAIKKSGRYPILVNPALSPE